MCRCPPAKGGQISQRQSHVPQSHMLGLLNPLCQQGPGEGEVRAGGMRLRLLGGTLGQVRRRSFSRHFTSTCETIVAAATTASPLGSWPNLPGGQLRFLYLLGQNRTLRSSLLHTYTPSSGAKRHLRAAQNPFLRPHQEPFVP